MIIDKEKFRVDNESYANDESNIAKLERLLKDYDGINYTGKFYIEGAGTEKLGLDDQDGFAFASGKTGIKAKLKKGMSDIYKEIGNAILSTKSNCPGTDVIITKIQFDFFGFSRGATTARMCIHEVLEGGESLSIKNWLKDKNYGKPDIKVEFVGLFDTVSTFSESATPFVFQKIGDYVGIDYSPDDNVEELHLKAVSQATKVYHIVAAEEYRLYFSLTDITSAGGEEVFLPGSHSDIGGGYPETSKEGTLPLIASLNPLTLSAARKWLIKNDWYDDPQLSIKGSFDLKNLGVGWGLFGERSDIVNDYSVIPMKIMITNAGKSQVMFVGRDPVHPDLQGFYEKVKDSPPTSKEACENILENKLRRRFLHFSGRFELGYHPNFTYFPVLNPFKYVRKVFHG